MRSQSYCWYFYMMLLPWKQAMMNKMETDVWSQSISCQGRRLRELSFAFSSVVCGMDGEDTNLAGMPPSHANNNIPASCSVHRMCQTIPLLLHSVKFMENSELF